MKNIVVILMVFAFLKTCGQQKASYMELHISLNGKTSLTVQQGFPWEIKVSLTNPAAQQAAMVKTLAEDEQQSVPEDKLESLNAIIGGYTFGSKADPWYKRITITMTARTNQQKITLPLERLNPVPDDIIVLNEENAGVAAFGVDPEKTILFDAGEYVIRASTPIPEGNDGRDTAWSDEINLSLKKPPLTDFLSLDNEAVYFIIGYWLKRDECKKAETLFNRFFENRNHSLSAWTLKAQIHECLGEDEKALESFLRALKLFEKDPVYEPPEYLWEKIHKLQEKLGNPHLKNQ